MDFPAPLWPTIARTSPRRTVREMSVRTGAAAPSYAKVTRSARMTAGFTGTGAGAAGSVVRSFASARKSAQSPR